MCITLKKSSEKGAISWHSCQVTPWAMWLPQTIP